MSDSEALRSVFFKSLKGGEFQCLYLGTRGFSSPVVLQFRSKEFMSENVSERIQARGKLEIESVETIVRKQEL